MTTIDVINKIQNELDQNKTNKEIVINRNSPIKALRIRVAGQEVIPEGSIGHRQAVKIANHFGVKFQDDSQFITEKKVHFVQVKNPKKKGK